MRERDLFIEALQQEGLARRTTYLDAACLGNDDLRRRIERLLDEHERNEEFILDAPPPGMAGMFTPLPVEAEGAQIGRYRLLEQVGEGGMGVVFMAEQLEPVRRKVALKVIKPGMDTGQVISRFEAERQALALMDHPNIARVLDAGTTDSGRPFFVMELVKGLPITDYCDQVQLTSRQRVKLFVSVCEAVQHAHQKGIIHRDLKPSNVLVTAQDGPPLTKIIDFGIAKATGGQLTEKTLFTGFFQMIGTPLYVSPEQAGQNPDIDTRSDIYSLGVLLYELLTGTTPFDGERFKKAAYEEICQIIREEDPPKPSTRLSESTESLGLIAVYRHTEPDRLAKQVRGELDWIVMKALEKDRNRRYETSASLALDLRRYLDDEPVQACPPSARYRFCKFARRNKTGLAIAVIIVCFVVLLGGGVGWIVRDHGARLAIIDREASLALDDAVMLQGRADWQEALEATKRAGAVLAGGGSKAVRVRMRELRRDIEMVLQLNDIALPKAGIGAAGALNIISIDTAYGQAFREYGIDVETLQLAEAVDRIRLSAIRSELIVALDQWTNVRYRRAKGIKDIDDERWKHLMTVAQTAEPTEWRKQIWSAIDRGATDALTGLAGSPTLGELPKQALSLLGGALDNAGAGQHAVAVLRQAQQKYPDDYQINFQLAWALDHQNPQQPDEAIRFYTAALAIRPNNIATNVILGGILRRQGKHDEARAAYHKASQLNRQFIAGKEKLMAQFSGDARYLPELVELHHDFARFLLSIGESVEAENELRQALLWSQQLAAAAPANADHRFRRAQLCVSLAQFLKDKSDDEAGAMYTEALFIAEGLADEDPNNASYRRALALYNNYCAWHVVRTRDCQKVEATEAVGRATKAVALMPQERGFWNTLGVAQFRAGSWKTALTSLETSMQLAKGGDSFDWFFMALACWQLDDKAKAREWFDRAASWMDTNAPRNEELLRFRTEAAELLGISEPLIP